MLPGGEYLTTDKRMVVLREPYLKALHVKYRIKSLSRIVKLITVHIYKYLRRRLCYSTRVYPSSRLHEDHDRHNIIIMLMIIRFP